MDDLNGRSTVDDAAKILWEKSADHVFAVAPVAWLPIDGKAARYSHLIIGSADATGAHFDQIPLQDGLDQGQMRTRLTDAIAARGSCKIYNFDNEAELAEFCAATWPEQRTAQEDEIALEEEFLNIKKQIEVFVLDRTKKALASSRIMNSNWHEMLETISDHFTSGMSILEAGTTVNQAKVRALGSINDAFSMGVLIGRSVSDEEVTQILATAKLVWVTNTQSIAGKKSGESRRANRPWVSHATELAICASGIDPQDSNEKIAGLISDNWKLEQPSAPGIRTLSGFVAELRRDGKLPQRTG